MVSTRDNAAAGPVGPQGRESEWVPPVSTRSFVMNIIAILIGLFAAL